MTTSEFRRCRVFVVDNNIDLAATLAEVIGLEPDLECVGVSCSGSDALGRAGDAGADVLVLDLSLPDRSALSVLEESKTTGARLDILIYTGYAAPEFAVEARARGAAGYLVKGGAFAELAGEIRRIYAARKEGGH
jgi:DNA-binding NarL/FixJ family response regulator